MEQGLFGLYRGMAAPLATVAAFNALLFSVRGFMESTLKHADGECKPIPVQLSQPLPSHFSLSLRARFAFLRSLASVRPLSATAGLGPGQALLCMHADTSWRDAAFVRSSLTVGDQERPSAGLRTPRALISEALVVWDQAAR